MFNSRFTLFNKFLLKFDRNFTNIKLHIILITMYTFVFNHKKMKKYVFDLIY